MGSGGKDAVDVVTRVRRRSGRESLAAMVSERELKEERSAQRRKEGERSVELSKPCCLV